VKEEREVEREEKINHVLLSYPHYTVSNYINK